MTSLASLILPNLAFWGLMLGLFIWGWRVDGRGMFGQGLAGRWTRACMVALFVLSIPALPRAALVLWTADYPPRPGVAPDAVVVFSAGIGGAPEVGYWPSGASMRRATLGARLARTHDVPLVLSGGGEVDLPSEASVIADALGYDGVVVLEEEARNTWENAIHMVDLARARGWNALLLVTDARHGRRALASLAARGAPVIGFAAASDPFRFSWTDAVPSVQGLAAWGAIGYEVAATASYIAKGRISVGDVLGGWSRPSPEGRAL
jgi:uncharacterized SAM-binding protein YcdF (DUF218 family)